MDISLYLNPKGNIGNLDLNHYRSGLAPPGHRLADVCEAP